MLKTSLIIAVSLVALSALAKWGEQNQRTYAAFTIEAAGLRCPVVQEFVHEGRDENGSLQAKVVCSGDGAPLPPYRLTGNWDKSLSASLW